MSKTEPMTVIEGGRRERELELLHEMIKPGIANIDKVRKMGDVLEPRGKLRAVTKTVKPSGQ